MRSIYIESFITNTILESPVLRLLKEDYHNKQSCVLFTVDKPLPPIFLNFFNSNGIELTGTFESEKLTVLSDYKKLNTSIKKLYVIDEQGAMPTATFSNLTSKFNVHYITSDTFFDSPLLKYTKNKDNFVINVSYAHENGRVGLLGDLFGNNRDILVLLDKMDLTKQRIIGDESYLAITHNSGLKLIYDPKSESIPLTTDFLQNQYNFEEETDSNELDKEIRLSSHLIGDNYEILENKLNHIIKLLEDLINEDPLQYIRKNDTNANNNFN